MTIQQIRYFIAVVNKGSFYKAATELYVSQPTISRAIASLEQEFGVQLFYREKTAQLTITGEHFYTKALKIVSAIEDLEASVKNMNAASLRISYHHLGNTIAFILLRSLQSFTEKWPDISISIRDHKPIEVSLLSLQPTCDFVFTLSYDVKKQSDVDYIDICPDDLAAIIPVTHPLSLKDKLCIEDILEYRVIRLGDVDIKDDIIHQYFKENNYSFKSVKTASSFAHMPLMVITGEGIALLPMSAVSLYGFAGVDAVRCIALKGCDIGLDIVLAWRKYDNNPLIPKFVEEVEYWKSKSDGNAMSLLY